MNAIVIAVFVTYRMPRAYKNREIGEVSGEQNIAVQPMRPKQLALALSAIVVALIVPLVSGSMLLGGLIGFAMLSMGGFFRWNEVDDVFVLGLRMMALSAPLARLATPDHQLRIRHWGRPPVSMQMASMTTSGTPSSRPSYTSICR